MRIATFNLENLDDRPGLDPPLSERIAVLRPQLMRLSADVLCLQEVNGQRPEGGGPRCLLALDRLLEETPYAGFARTCTRSGSDGGAADVHNLVILSRWPITAQGQLHHDLVPAPAKMSAGRAGCYQPRLGAVRAHPRFTRAKPASAGALRGGASGSRLGAVPSALMSA